MILFFFKQFDCYWLPSGPVSHLSLFSLYTFLVINRFNSIDHGVTYYSELKSIYIYILFTPSVKNT